MDTIADLITRIRNGYLAKKERVEAPFSLLSEALCRLLASHGYVESVSVVTRKTVRGSSVKWLDITLAYQNGKPTLTGIKRISTLGRRRYVRARGIPRVLGGFGMTIVSTSKGLMTDRDARKGKLGGEALCSVW